MNISFAEYLDKVTACWLGKCVGGTLGMPLEWKRQVNDVTFYLQELKGEPVPNDDLDIQLIWLLALEDYGVDLDAHILASRWLDCLVPAWSEYGLSKANLRHGLPPPFSGSHFNPYKHSCGSFIRTEIWACIAPGRPDLATALACEDSIIDHGDGEGTFAALFVAALEAAAFFEARPRELVEIGLSYIPESCATAKAVRMTLQAFDAGRSLREIRDAVLNEYRGVVPAWTAALLSEEDKAKGFDEGQEGFDAPSNIAFLVLGLLIAEHKGFDEAICSVVNCGEDTDCTAGTFGALYGIMHGSKAIPEKWTEPIGRKIKTCCLNLSDFFYSGRIPKDIDELSVRVAKLMEQCKILHPSRAVGVLKEGEPGDPLQHPAVFKDNGKLRRQLELKTRRVTWRSPDDLAHIEVQGGPFIKPGETKEVFLEIEARHWHPQKLFAVQAQGPEGWRISPSAGTVACQPQIDLMAWLLSVPAVASKDSVHGIHFSVTAPSDLKKAAERIVFEIEETGRPWRLSAPLLLLSGSGS